MSEQILHFIKRVTRDQVVRLRYAVFDSEQGECIEFRDDLYYLHGGYGGAFPKVEAALEGKQVDDKVEVTLSSAEGYGERDPARVLQVAADELPAEVRPGVTLDGEGPDGSLTRFRVIALQDGLATLDGNHPLAGRNLRMVMEILEIRKASQAELTAGYAFPPQGGAGGKHH